MLRMPVRIRIPKIRMMSRRLQKVRQRRRRVKSPRIINQPLKKLRLKAHLQLKSKKIKR